MWRDLIDIAQHLIADDRGQVPTQAALRRSVSTSYYALFSATSLLVANTLIGDNGEARRSNSWQRAFRSLEHGTLKTLAKALDQKPQDADLQRWASAFLVLQETRHLADYDPDCKISISDAMDCLKLAASSSSALSGMPTNIALDFVSQIAFQSRR